jgi:hypothetical protein
MHHRFTKTGSGRTHRESSSSSTQQARSMRCAFSFARETVSYASLGRKQPVSVWSQEVEVNSWDQERGIRTTEMRHEVYIYSYLYMQHAACWIYLLETEDKRCCCMLLLSPHDAAAPIVRPNVSRLVLSRLVILSCLVLSRLVSSRLVSSSLWPGWL